MHQSPLPGADLEVSRGEGIFNFEVKPPCNSRQLATCLQEVVKLEGRGGGGE